MYSLNINFLKDRPEFQTGKQAADKKRGGGVSLGGQVPLILGAVVGLALPAAALGAYGYLIWDMGNLDKRILALDQNLSDLQQDLDRAAKAERTTQVIKDQTDALTGVFNRVKSWAATLEDIRDRLPQGVQLQSVTEEPPDASASSASASSASASSTPPAEGAAPPPPPRSKITIMGYASSAESIGEFLLLLRSSPYLDPTATVLVGAEMVDNPAQVEAAQAGAQATEPTEGSSYTIVNPEALEAAAAEVGQLPQLLEYTITTTYTSKPAEELLQALDRSSATGLVVRLEAIRNIRAAAEGAPATGSAPADSDGSVQQEAP